MSLGDCLPPSGSSGTPGSSVTPVYGSTPSGVQQAVNSMSYTATFGAAPTSGTLLIAFGVDSAAIPTTNTGAGWATQQTDHAFTNVDVYGSVAWRYAGASEPAAQTPFTGTPTKGGVCIIQITGTTSTLATILEQLVFGVPATSGNAEVATSIATLNDNDLVVAMGVWFGTTAALMTINSGWGTPSTADAAGASSELVAARAVAAHGTVITADITMAQAVYGMMTVVIVIKPDPASITWVPPSDTSLPGIYPLVADMRLQVAADASKVILAPQGPVRVNVETTTARTLAMTDHGALISFTNVAASTVTIPTDASVGILPLSQVFVAANGGVKLTVTPAGGVTLSALSSEVPPGCVGVLTKTAANTWRLDIWGGGNAIGIGGGRTFESGTGIPSRTDRTIGSLFASDTGDLWQNTGIKTLSVVQSALKVTNPTDWTITPTTLPTAGNYLIAVGLVHRVGGAVPSANTGWTIITTHAASVSEGCWALAYYPVPGSPPATVTPFTGGGISGANVIIGLWEVSGIDPTWANSFETVFQNQIVSGSITSLTVGPYTSTHANDLALTAIMGEFAAGPATPAATLSAGWTDDGSISGGTTDYFPDMRLGHEFFAANGSSISVTGTWGSAQNGVTGLILVLNPGPATGWEKLSFLTKISLNGSVIDSDPRSINFVGDFEASTDGFGNVTVSHYGPYVDIVCSENLAAGAFVSFWNSTGAKVRNADSTDGTKQAHGFVRQAYTTGQTARVYTAGVNDKVAGLTPGTLYFLGTAGGVTATPPSAAGTWLQELGHAADATHLPFANKSGSLN